MKTVPSIIKWGSKTVYSPLEVGSIVYEHFLQRSWFRCALSPQTSGFLLLSPRQLNRKRTIRHMWCNKTIWKRLRHKHYEAMWINEWNILNSQCTFQFFKMIYFTIFEILKMMSVINVIFWDVTPYSPVRVYRAFELT